MKIAPEHNGTVIGAIFTGVCLLATFTFVVPILSVIPGVLVESLMKTFVDNNPYSNVGKATIISLILILVVSVVLILRKSRKEEFSNKKIIAIMCFEYFIIHSLGFYIYWATSLNFRSDGQLIFGAVRSFPASSFGFVILGVLIDQIKLKPRQSLNKE